jgi:short-subunit dehydrogenase
MLTDTLRMELLPFGIDVVLVEPAAVRSNIAVNASRGLERYASDSSHYRQVHEHIEARARTSQENPMDADTFARQLVEAVTRAKPPRVVRLGHGASAVAALAQLPRFTLDRILSKRFGLNELHPQNDHSHETDKQS